MLTIEFKDGNFKSYSEDDFTDYEYRKEVFVVMKNVQWIGIYSMDCIRAIEYKEVE